MDNINNISTNQPKVVIRDEKTQPVTGAICVGSNNEIRVGFIEEKLANDEMGNVEIIRECRTQIVMSREVARNIIHTIEDNLNSSSIEY